ncbi:hypothetical protein [Paenibacillus daejeonensis]|uniref:hypothetical protein n=1 Tax=Paenibacillus daejeonensis TaxID=135193 RepID=UPI000364461D|nr:hypothetical protein [Paenibacillus daejeonensis]
MSKFLKRYGLFILAGLILIGGIGVSGAAMMATVVRMERIELPLDTTIELRLQPGTYLIFQEFEIHSPILPVSASFTTETPTDEPLNPLSVEVFKEQHQLRVHPDTSTTYTLNGKGGRSNYRFHADQETWYTLHLTSTEAMEEGETFTLRKDFMDNLIVMLKQMGVIFLVFVTLGAAGTIVCLRSFRAEREGRLSTPK